MSRAPKPAPVNDDPALPTQPRPRDAQGFELAEDGLPLSGPARAAAIAAGNAAQAATPTPDPEA